MAGIENLFIIDSKLPNVQTQKAPDDLQLWPEFLTTCIKETFPAASMLPVSVAFKKKDPKSGTAIGTLNVVSEESGKSLLVPFIVRQFELCPLDIWMEKGTQNVHPLSNETFKEVFFSKSPAEGLDQRPADAIGQYFNDPSLWTTNYPPLQGRYSYASDGYPLLDQIADTIREKDLEEFREELRKDPSLLTKFQKHGHQEIITKLAKLKGKSPVKSGDVPVNINDFAASALRLIPVSAASIKREGKDKYSIFSSPDQQFDTIDDKNFTRHECLEQIAKITANASDLMSDVDQSGERMLITTEPEKGVFLYDYYWKDKPEDAKEFAQYWIRTKEGVGVEGIVFPNVVTLDGKKAPYKIFCSPNHSTFQSQIAGVKLTDGSTKQAALEKLMGRVRTGQTGTFIYVDDGKAVATEPLTIKAVSENGPITAVRLSGQRVFISQGYSSVSPSLTASNSYGPKGEAKPKVLDIHAMIEQRPGEYIIPRNMIWIPMERFTEVTATPAEWLNKFASEKVTMSPLVIRYTGSIYESTDGQQKLSFDERRTRVLLASKGAPLEMIPSIMKCAKDRGKAVVHGLRVLRKKADIIKEAKLTEERLEKIALALRATLIKEAAEIDQKATVDHLLGLKFLNPDNLAKFVAYRPIMDKVQDCLAELTLASRLGMKDVSESACVSAMHKLRDISDGLKKTETVLKQVGSKTASEKKPDHHKLKRPSLLNAPDTGKPSRVAELGGLSTDGWN